MGGGQAGFRFQTFDNMLIVGAEQLISTKFVQIGLAVQKLLRYL